MRSKKTKQAQKALRAFYSSWIKSREIPEVYNNSLRARVLVNSVVSCRETSHYASLSPVAREMVLTGLTDILRYARKTGEFPPKANAGQSRFTRLINLERNVKGLGTAKLTVGVLPDGRLVQYCITATC